MARAALSWGHHAWWQRLQSGAFRRAGRHVVETDEAFTTMTCGLCGTLNRSVGAAETFECPNRPACGVCIDRDVNGARNIALKVLTRNLNAAQ